MNKQEAWQYYKTWMKEKTYCKALKAEVKITRKGWDHLITGGIQKRTAKDKHNRFQLLKFAKVIIKTANTFSMNQKHSNRYYLLESKNKKNTIKVLLKKDKNNSYYFYSVMKH